MHDNIDRAGEAQDEAIKRRLLELAFAFHVGIEGEYGCPGESCPGVQRLVAAFAALEGVGRAERLRAFSGSPEQESLRSILKLAALHNGPFANQVWRLANEALYPETEA